MKKNQAASGRGFGLHKNRGFTLVELLVVVLVIAIIVAIALPNYIGSQQKAKSAAVRLNMRTTQIAGECYSTDSAGVYGTINQIAPYFPSGDAKLGGTPGAFPTNPITCVANETPGAGGIATTAEIVNNRAQAPAAFLSKGQHSYDVVDAGTSFAVMGSDSQGMHVTGTTGNRLVLSNQ